MTIRAASDPKQPGRSIDDQIHLCREIAERRGADVVAVFADAAISGSHIALRPEVQKLMAAARQREFDMLIAESLDRLTRDLEDAAASTGASHTPASAL